MLFLKERIDEAVEILKTFEPPDGYYLAFSGGKDSVVLHAVAEESGVRFDSHYNITSADPPEVIHFIRDQYPAVKFERPEYTMWNLIPKKLMPPTVKVRYCCDFLKERGGRGRIVLTGVKKTDSRSRQNRLVYQCYRRGITAVRPLLNWTDTDVWAFIRGRRLLYCSLYDEGWKRLGCVGCPLARPRTQVLEFERWPKFRAMYVRAFDRMLVERRKKDKRTDWKNGEEVMAWWLERGQGGRRCTSKTSA